MNSQLSMCAFSCRSPHDHAALRCFVDASGYYWCLAERARADRSSRHYASIVNTPRPGATHAPHSYLRSAQDSARQ